MLFISLSKRKAFKKANLEGHFQILAIHTDRRESQSSEAGACLGRRPPATAVASPFEVLSGKMFVATPQ